MIDRNNKVSDQLLKVYISEQLDEAVPCTDSVSNLIEMLGAYDVIPHLNYIPQWMLHDILWARKNGNSNKTSLKERLN